MRKQRNNRGRRQIPDAERQTVSAIKTKLDELVTTTQVRVLADQKDKVPMELPRQGKIITATRSYQGPTITTDLLGDQGALYFALDQCGAPTDFTSLYDQYRIVEATVTFLPATAPYGASTTSTEYPMLATAIDTDDATSINFAGLLNYGTVQYIQPGQMTVRTLTPRFAKATFQAGGFTAYSPSNPRDWCDSAYPSIQYYGLKWATSPVTLASGSNVLFNTIVKLVIQLRATH